MLNWVVSSSILILLVLALRAAVKDRVSPRLRYALWLLVLLRLLIPGNLGSTRLSVLNAVETAQTQIQVQVQNQAHPQTPATGNPAGTPDQSPVGGVTGAPAQSQQTQTPQDPSGGVPAPTVVRELPWTDILLVLWAVGAAVTAACLLTVNIRFYVDLRRRRIWMGSYKNLPVYAAGDIASPCLAGLVKPVIYITPEVLPDQMARIHVLAHEYTHYRQRDYIWSALRSVCLALHWYNPLVWIAAAASRRDCELSCDAGAVGRLGEGQRASYGRTLVSLVVHAAAPADLLCCATTMTGKKSAVKERVALLVKNPRTTIAALCLVGAMAILFAACSFTGPAHAAGPEGEAGQTVYEVPEYRFDTMDGHEEFFHEDGTQLAYYDYQYPSMSVNNLDALSPEDRAAAERNIEAFNAAMRQRIEAAAYGTTSVDNARADYADGYFIPGEPYYETTTSSVYVRGQIVSVISLYGYYSGGAHPNYAYSSRIFDLGTGTFIESTAIADDPDAFRAGAAEKLIAYSETLGEEFAAEAWPDYRDAVREWDKTGAVIFDESGMSVFYSPYDLGPYAMGGVELTVSYEDLAELLGQWGMVKLGLTEEPDGADPIQPGEEQADMGNVYADILKSAFSGEQSAYDYYDWNITDPDELAKNQFAVYDVDGDGRDELIIAYTNSTAYAGNTLTVYGYDPASGEVRQKLLEFPLATFYSNGYVAVQASHNHGRASMTDFWPYHLYRYAPETDTYEEIAIVDAWYREQNEAYGDQHFPAAADLDGDGLVYYITEAWDYADPMDGAAYQQWVDSWQAGASRMDIPWQALTMENIGNIQ